MARRFLLTIDGGGIRGILPARALARLEETTGKPARETFSFIGGTSTGAVIAAGLAAGVPAQQILDLYVKRAREILPRRPWNLIKRAALGRMYSTENLHQIISGEIGDAQSWTLNDSPVDLLVTAKRISDGTPWYFVKDAVGNSGRTGRLKLVDCVVASAAAPTYFAPWTMPEPPDSPPGTEPIGALVDGGVGVAGNPVYQSCVEAFDYTNLYSPEETTVISLGTGAYAKWDQPRWIVPWIRWLLSELLRSPGEQQTELVKRHFPDALLFRIDTELHRNISLDDAKGTAELLEIANRLAERIDWEAILDGTDTEFRIEPRNTQWQQYKVEVV